MTDRPHDIWVAATSLRAAQIDDEAPDGLYLLEYGRKPVWLTGSGPRALIFLDDLYFEPVHDRAIDAFYLGEAILAVDPLSFAMEDARRTGQLTYRLDGIYMQCSGRNPGMIGPRIKISSLPHDEEARPIGFAYCSRWRLLVRDVDDELRAIHELDVRPRDDA